MRASEWPRDDSIPASVSNRRGGVELVGEEIALLGLARRGDARFPPLAHETGMALLELGRHHLRRDSAIGAERNVVFARDLDHVLEVADDVRRGRLPALAQERHEIDAGHAAFLGDGAQFRIRAIARVIVLRGAARVRECDRPGRRLDRVGRRLPAAMAEVHEDPERVHLLDGLDARLAEARVRRLEAAVAEQVPPVVRRLHDANPQAMQLVEP